MMFLTTIYQFRMLSIKATKIELTPSQIVTTIQWIIFLKQAYLAVLNVQLYDKIHFKQCCEDAEKNVANLDLALLTHQKF